MIDRTQDRQAVVAIVYAVVDDLNASEFAEKPLSKCLDSPLFGKNGALDSLDLVHLVLAIEDRVEDSMGFAISLSDNRAMSQERSPFRTLGSLADYIQQLLNERQVA